MDELHLSICICTRNRGASVCATLTSIACSTYANYDVIIVDQSTTDATETAARALIGDDARFLYIRSATVGASAARNIAVAHATGPLIAFTDDDCEVAPDWLAHIVTHFQAHPEVGQLCGDVRLAPHDKTRGFIPEYVAAPCRKTKTPLLKWREFGVLANMAFRREVIERVGPFDEALGPGAAFYLGEDDDMTYRVLKAGYAVLSVQDAYVIHKGFRAWPAAREQMRHAGVGLGAAYMKHVRLGDLSAIPILIFEWMRCVSVWRLLLLRRRSGARYALGYAEGVLRSLRYPIDRHTHTYVGVRSPVLAAQRACAPLVEEPVNASAPMPLSVALLKRVNE